MKDNDHICPVEHADALDIKLRKYLHNPYKILQKYIKPGLNVLDVGCGPGFFTTEIAKLVGNEGKVIAADLQEGMLQKVKYKIGGTQLEERITLHQCAENRVGITQTVDLVFAFYMVHEVPDQQKFLKEMHSVLDEGGLLYITEPRVHVSGKTFTNIVEKAKECGFEIIDNPKIFFSRSAVLRKI